MSNNPLCELVPFYLALTFISTGISDYYKIEQVINSYILETNISATYDAESCSFTCTQLYDGDNERIDVITIFWNETTAEHIVEVRRLRGDTLFHCSLSRNIHRIYNELEELFKRQNQQIKP